MNKLLFTSELSSSSILSVSTDDRRLLTCVSFGWYRMLFFILETYREYWLFSSSVTRKERNSIEAFTEFKHFSSAVIGLFDYL